MYLFNLTEKADYLFKNLQNPNKFNQIHMHFDHHS